jgi:hypothetical protein
MSERVPRGTFSIGNTRYRYICTSMRPSARCLTWPRVPWKRGWLL